MCDQGDESRFDGGIVMDVTISSDSHSHEDETNVDQMDPAVAIPQSDLETSPQGCTTESTVTFVELGLLGTGSGEDGDFATEPFGKEEGPDDGDGVERSHPHHGSELALADMIARGKV